MISELLCGIEHVAKNEVEVWPPALTVVSVMFSLDYLDLGNESFSAAVSPSTAGAGSQPAEGTSAQVQELLGFGTQDTAMRVLPKSLESAMDSIPTADKFIVAVPYSAMENLPCTLLVPYVKTVCCVGVCPSSSMVKILPEVFCNLSGVLRAEEVSRFAVPSQGHTSDFCLKVHYSDLLPFFGHL